MREPVGSPHSASDGPSLVLALEVGGSKVLVARGTNWRDVRDSEHLVLETGSPEETLDAITAWTRTHRDDRVLGAIGVASFGPLDFERSSIRDTTPKRSWRGFNWRRSLGEHFGDLPLALDTDTNAAALAEWRWGVATGCAVVLYITVGTGVGGGLLVEGHPVHGLVHPELGHVRVPRHPEDRFEGLCLAHGDCLEGLASAPALAARWGEAPTSLGPEHRAWEIESHYLALAVANAVATCSPNVVVLGGGVMNAAGLLERVRERTRELFAGYLAVDELGDSIERYVVSPAFTGTSGLLGAFALGADAAPR